MLFIVEGSTVARRVESDIAKRNGLLVIVEKRRGRGIAVAERTG
jgi:hypothetical protein